MSVEVADKTRKSLTIARQFCSLNFFTKKNDQKSYAMNAENVQNRLLVVDDDKVTCFRLKSYFESQGYIVSIALNGDEMWRILAGDTVSLVLLDIGLPGKDGLELARELRTLKPDICIILVTGRDDDIDRIVGLESGADDYVTKPFNSRELLARVKNLLRRSHVGVSAGAPEVFFFSGWRLDISHRSLHDRDGNPVELTRGEFELLALLLRNPGVVLSRDTLMHSVSRRAWDPTDRTVDVLIRRLRGKLELDSAHPQIITTVRGEGYVFTSDIKSSAKTNPG